jgi:hypothetical protein
MSELTETIYNKHYDTPELFPERDLLESLGPDRLKDFIQECGIKIVELRRLETLASDVLSGYGEEV